MLITCIPKQLLPPSHFFDNIDPYRALYRWATFNSQKATHPLLPVNFLRSYGPGKLVLGGYSSGGILAAKVA